MPYKYKTNPFNEQTLLSTPSPVCSSSMAENSRNKRETFGLDDIPGRLSEANSSLGILSLKDSLSPRTSLDLNSRLEEQRSLALSALDRANSSSPQVIGIPSRYLRRSDISQESSSGTQYVNSESTISESDLLRTSTPRNSTNALDLNQVKGRHSISQSLSRLSQISKTANIDELMKNFNEFINPNTIDYTFASDDFQSGAEIEKRLLDEEMSWKHDKNLPTEVKEFSVDHPPPKDLSMEAFFRGRSEDCSNLVSESFKNVSVPIALIDDTASNSVAVTNDRSNVLKDQNSTLSITKIQKILEDTKQTPTKALDLFLNPKKKINSLTPMKKSKSFVAEVDSDGFVKPCGAAPQSRASSRTSLNIVKTSSRDDTKENESKDSVHNKSNGSLRSSSSLSNLPGGKLPIETTKSEIIWGCVKVGKSSTHDFTIRNKSASKVRFELVLSNIAFKVVSERNDDSSNNVRLTLHPYESKTIVVMFAPTKIGAFVTYLHFVAMNANQQLSRQFIRLFGYGGVANVVINTITRDPTGKFLISLGSLDNSDIIEKKFILRNEGVLPAFVFLSFTSQGFYEFTSIAVKPDRGVILPNEQIEICVTYYPKKEDFDYIKSKINFSIADIGKLTLIHGSEVDRGRLRKVCLKAKTNGREIPSSASILVEPFPREAMPSDLREFKESSGSLNEILKLFSTKEIVLYFEHDGEKTFFGNFQDETALFQSLYENETQMMGNTFITEGCSVEPSKILITPPSKETDFIILSNHGKKTLYFEVQSSPEGLKIKPLNGLINPEEKLSVSVRYEAKACKDQILFLIRVLVENEVHEVHVKVLNLTKV